MALELSWAGEEAIDRVAEVRMRCFGSALKDRDKYKEGARLGLQQKPREFLLAELDGQDVGTVTSLGYTMWVRGGAVPCQGVAYVGTIKTHRRGGGGEKGIASRLMVETIRRARETGQWASALMPFRASYYEHFGYGLVERRNEWTLPMGVLPQGDFAGFRFYRDADLPALMDCRARVARQGQCDIERSEAVWRSVLRRSEDGIVVVDRPEKDGPIHSWMTLFSETVDGKNRVRVGDLGAESIEAMKRQFYFLSSLQDQHPVAVVHLPADLDLNWLLRESQVALTPTNHATAMVKTYTRMQVKILDHRKVIEAMRFPADVRGSATVAVAESEGTTAEMRLAIEGGRASVTATTNDAGFACPDRVWAAIVCGELSARTAVRMGLAKGDAAAVGLLDAFSAGPRPFCGEAF